MRVADSNHKTIHAVFRVDAVFKAESLVGGRNNLTTKRPHCYNRGEAKPVGSYMISAVIHSSIPMTFCVSLGQTLGSPAHAQKPLELVGTALE